MAENQQSGSPSGQGSAPKDSGQKLSWGQPAASANKPAGTARQLPPGSQNSSRMIGVFVAGLIIGLLLAWAWFDLRGGTKNTGTMASSTEQFSVTQTAGQEGGAAASGTNAAAGQSGMTTNDAVVVPDPQPAGKSVTVSSITSDAPVWAVVYSGTNEILGASRFATQKSGSVPLLNPTVAGKSYWVGLVTDTPDHTWGNHADHQPILGTDGMQVKATFTAQ